MENSNGSSVSPDVDNVSPDDDTSVISSNIIKVSVSEVRQGQKAFLFDGNVKFLDFLTKVNINIIAIDNKIDAFSIAEKMFPNTQYLTTTTSVERMKGEGDILYFNDACEFYIAPVYFGELSKSLVEGMIGSVTYESKAYVDYSKILPRMGVKIEGEKKVKHNDSGEITLVTELNYSDDTSVVTNLQQNESYVREVTWYNPKNAKGIYLLNNNEALVTSLEDNDYKGALSIRTVLTQNKAIQTFSV